MKRKAKLSLYASLHSAVASHKPTLGEQEKALTEARESLVREGGAVVGGGAIASAMQAEKPNGEQRGHNKLPQTPPTYDR